MTQPELSFTEQTRAAAHEAIKPVAPTIKARMLALYQERGYDGLTDAECSEMLGIQYSTVNPRRGELVKAQQVFATERTRKTTSGRQAVVWCAVGRGE